MVFQGQKTKKMNTIDFKDPWKDISPPDHVSLLSARRADPSLKWDVFWAVDYNSNCLLVLQYSKGIKLRRRLPIIRGLRIEAHAVEHEPRDRITIRLIEHEQRDIFYRFCLDIIAATGMAVTEEDAVGRFFSRTWRWHRLLKTGSDDRLGTEEQRGLIGELGILERHLIPLLGSTEAVQCWSGPLGSPKDFEIGDVCIEAKTRRAVAKPEVIINSEHQLESSGIQAMFLYVTEVTQATSEDEDAFTVTMMARRIHATVANSDIAAVGFLEDRLNAAGFDWDDDYSGCRWIMGQCSMYDVRDDFPKITSSDVPSGISKLRYTLSLPDCETWRVETNELNRVIAEGDRHDES